MVVTARPASHTSATGLQVVLTPLYQHDSLPGFCLSVKGESTQTFSIPESMDHNNLGTQIIVHIISANFNFSHHTLSSRWKSGRALILHKHLYFKTPKAESSKSSKSDSAKSQVVNKDTTIAALKTHPLTLNLALTVVDNARDIALSVLIVSRTSDKLNEGTLGFDPDDVHRLGRVSLITTMGAPVGIDLVD